LKPNVFRLEVISLSSDEEEEEDDEKPPARKIHQRSYNQAPFGSYPIQFRLPSHSISSRESSNLDEDIITIDD
jgi:hypothetical protein